MTVTEPMPTPAAVPVPVPLSVIVPTFNAAATIARCLDSIVAQTRVPHEVWVIDGLSRDDTLAIVRGYAERYPFIRCTSERDAGIYDAMNKGVSRAGAEWVYFLGADDTLIDAQVLAAVAAYLVASADFVYGKVWHVAHARSEGRAFDLQSLFAQNICHQAIFYRRELFRTLGPFALDYKVYADWEFNLRCFGAGCRIRHIDVTVCAYDGGGFSAGTIDAVFMERKLPLVAAAYGVSYWHRTFRPFRHAFQSHAGEARVRRQWWRAARFYLLYAYHGMLAGEAGVKLLRRLTRR